MDEGKTLDGKERVGSYNTVDLNSISLGIEGLELEECHAFACGVPSGVASTESHYQEVW